MERLFVAIEIPQSVTTDLVRICDSLKKKAGGLATGMRWVPARNFHLTLIFLGDRDDREHWQTKLLSLAQQHREIELTLDHLSAFPSLVSPEVIWAGPEHVSSELGCLHQSLQAFFRAHGVTPEDREFVPHVTLARLKRRSEHPSFNEDRTERMNLLKWHASSFSLYRSTLTPEGSRYEILRRFPLKG